MHYFSKIKLSLFLNTLLIPLVIKADEQEKKADSVRKYYAREKSEVSQIGEHKLDKSLPYIIEDQLKGLDARAYIDSKRAIFYTSLLNKAVDLDNLEDAEELLKEGIGANIRYPMVDNFEAMRKIINVLNNNDNTSAHEKLLGVYPIQLVRSVEMLNLLMRYDACVDAATFPHSRNKNASLTALGRAIRWYRSPELVEALLERGATVIDLWEQKTYLEELEDLKKNQNNPMHKEEREKIINLLEGYKKYMPAK